MSPAELIASVGGVLVASFELDADGETVGMRRTHNRRTTCSVCGEQGHTISRCNGIGEPPRPTYAERRGLAETKRILREARRSR